MVTYLLLVQEYGHNKLAYNMLLEATNLADLMQNIELTHIVVLKIIGKQRIREEVVKCARKHCECE